MNQSKRADKEHPPEAAETAPSQEPLDLAVMRSLLSLTNGEADEFIECEIPSLEVQQWIRRANRTQLNGLLISTLNRWHQMRRKREEANGDPQAFPEQGSS